jgi:hypothetical protein
LVVAETPTKGIITRTPIESVVTETPTKGIITRTPIQAVSTILPKEDIIAAFAEHNIVARSP